jgi:AcrR family transcriptional regulator
MDRQAQFRAREVLIFQIAEQLLLENGEAGMTLDALAAELDLAKGTLYKHFQSKDELYMLLIIRNERMLLEMIQDTEKSFPEHLAFFMLHHLHHPERTALFHQIEERLSTTGQGIQLLFSELYKVRRQRLRIIIRMTESYLLDINSTMTTHLVFDLWRCRYSQFKFLPALSWFKRYSASCIYRTSFSHAEAT